MSEYVLAVGIEYVDPNSGEVTETDTETTYFETREQAQRASEQYVVGDIDGVYGDGTEARVASVEIEDQTTAQLHSSHTPAK